jgi:tRNA 2-selenouridine synthase
MHTHHPVMERVAINEFLTLMNEYPAFDVRTPKEFRQGHIPGAVNLPIFTNDERAIVGTIYKRSGREKAILTGLDIVGPKMRWLAESVKKKAKRGTALFHCWRGGMRSESVAWLAGYTGTRAIVLEKGYKAYRIWCIERFSEERKIVILSGRTGSGKTEILHTIAARGEQMIDLEGIANHKGSAFGAIGQPPQPTQEQFENDLGLLLSKTDPARRLWLEDESREIGFCVIPDAFWPRMRSAGVIFADVPFERRVDYLLSTYGSSDMHDLVQCAMKIERRFGHERTRACIDALAAGDIRRAISISLEYYDRGYAHGLAKRDMTKTISVAADDSSSFDDIAHTVIEAANRGGF